MTHGGRSSITRIVPRPADSALTIDWGSFAPLRIKARAVAEGLFAGMHRSVRKGPGVEFGGQRPYVPGDDLRFIDRRALLRHERWMVRQFETETDRALFLCVDATASMAYRSSGAPGSKVAFAALLGAALARVALASGDPVGLSWLGGRGARPLSPMAGREAFERVVSALEEVTATGDMGADPAAIDLALGPIGRRARRGSVIVLLSDLLDLPDRALSSFCALATRDRTILAVRVLDPAEVALGFTGTVRLKAAEGDFVVEADVDQVRAQYQERLASVALRWSRELEARGGRLIDATTTGDASEVLRAVIRAIAGGPGSVLVGRDPALAGSQASGRGDR